ncbi:MAG: 2Fe-2S iron-sulfur cluster binding domain-containing protein [Ruminococcaceae bacterium]|nr:2Fe-2S iron-sulfur cluster binding domain-containing protein [Oscillospiraceae bacterium]
MKDKVIVTSALKDFSNFVRIPENRKSTINQALNTPLKKNFVVNSNANFLHPEIQYLKVREVIEINRDERCYILTPDTAHGTGKLAFFRPGQYLSITLNIGSSVVTRPFTICSSPYDSSDDDFYMIKVKKAIHGFATTHIFNTWEKGTEVIASAPLGNFYYQTLRDYPFLIGIADNDGIPAFLSMARAIEEKSLSVNLTLFYSCRKKSDAVFMDELSEIQKNTRNFNVIFVFSDEKVENYERGFITKQLIEKYAPPEKYSIFIDGSTQLLNLISTQITELGLERKAIRLNIGSQIKDSRTIPDFPVESIGKAFECKVKKDGKVIATINCPAEETILVALERAGIPSLSHCRVGSCGFCRARLTKGNVFIPNGTDSRRLADTKHGIIHPCVSYAMSDLTIQLN